MAFSDRPVVSREVRGGKRPLTVLSGVGVWAVVVGATPGRGITGSVVIGLALGMAAILLLWNAGTVRRVWAGWVGLALVGQAAALQLVHAGPSIGYQHVRVPFPVHRAAEAVAVGILVVQVVLVAIGLARERERLVRWWAALPPGRWLLLGVVLLALSATVSRSPGFYAAELLAAFGLQLLGLGNLVLVALTFAPADLDRLRHLLARRLDGARGDRTPWLAALWVTGVAAGLAFWSYQRHPHVPDEVGYLYHAKYFAAGLLSMPAPPVREAFDLAMMTIRGDHWYGIFPPAWPAVLALGVRVGAPWLVNPLLAGLNALLLYRLTRGLFGRDTARKVTLLYAASPWVLFMAMSFMAHTVTLTFALVAALGVVRARQQSDRWWIWAGVAGVGVGLVSLVRPLDGVIAALALGLWLLWPGRLRGFLAVTVMAVVTAGTASLQLAYNRQVTGDALRFPVSEYMDAVHGPGTNALGFGANRGAGWTGLDPFPGHGPVDVVVNANLNLTVTNVELFGWMTASLALLAFLFLSGGAKRADWVALGMSGIVIAVLSLYWFSGGPDFGARYWFLVLVPWLLLSVRGWDRLAAWIERAGLQHARGRVAVGIGVAVCGAMLLFVPWRAVDKYRHYRSMEPGMRTLVEGDRLDGGLVLVRGNRFPDYMSAAIYNRVGFPDRWPVIAYAASDQTVRDVVRAFPARPVWVVDGPTRSGHGFVLRGGPYPPGEPPPP